MAERFSLARRFFPALLLVLPLLLLTWVPAALAAPVSFGEVEIGLESEPRGHPNHGYTEYRFWVRNRGSERARRVTLVLPANTISGRGGGLRSISRTIEIGPGRIGIVSLLQPSAPDVPGSGVSVYLDGRRQEDILPLSPVNGRSGLSHHARRRVYISKPAVSSAGENLILLSQRVNEKLYSVAVVPGGMGMGMPGAIGAAGGPPVIIGGPGAGGMVGAGGMPRAWEPIRGQFIRSDVGVSTWSERWLAYTRYDGITLTREDLEELQRGPQTSQAILQALWQYVEAGGSLVVLGPGPISLPATWNRPPVKVDGMDVYSVGFGRCLLTPERNSSKWSEGRWSVLARTFSTGSQPWRNTSGTVMQYNQDFPVVDDVGVPVKGLFVLMILFAIAIGPANLAVLTRKKRRIWLLWTVPVLSLCFCAFVLGYMIVAEGWTGHARIAGLTLLDEGAKRATTLGKAAFYSPLTPGDGLRFTEETEVQIPGDDHTAFGSTCSIDWTGEQHLARGWVTARVPSHFVLRKSEPLRRERMTLHTESDGSLSVTNALGVDVKTLYLATEKGRVYTAGPVIAGARVKLELAGKPDVSPWPPNLLRETFGNRDWAQTINTIERRPESMLAPGTYVAVTDSNPFLEQPLKGARVRPSSSIILGMMAAVEKK